MAKFVFSLQPLLMIRQRREREAQRTLAEKQAATVEIEHRLHELQQRVEESSGVLRADHLTGLLDVSYLQAHRRFVMGTGRRAVLVARELAAAQQAVEEARADLVEAARDRKAIEKLREKQIERWQEAQALLEAQSLDEVSTQMHYAEAVEGESRPS